MNKYKYRHLKRLSKGVSIAYLSTAILWGVAGYSCHIKREELKNSFLDENISHEYYIEKSIQFSEKEEKIFKCLSVGFGLTFVADTTCAIIGYGKEY